MVNLVMVLSTAILSVPEVFEKKKFDKDERGKYIVYNVIETRQSVSSAALYDHALSYFSQAGNKGQIEEQAQDRLRVRGNVKLSKHAGIGNYVAGAIHYRLVMEMKDGKYRYWLTDFVYQPFVKDRYGKIVPVRGKFIPLEDNMSKLNQGIWEKQRGYAYEEIARVAESLEAHMRPLAEGEAQPETVRIKDDSDWGRSL